MAWRSKSTAAILGDVAGWSLACRSLACRTSVHGGLALRPIAGGSLGRLDLPQVAADLAELVAQLGGVLEPQVLRGGQHLLLELHRHPLELVLWHLLGRRPARPAAAAPARNLGLRLQELSDVGDALDDRRGRDP